MPRKTLAQHPDHVRSTPSRAVQATETSTAPKAHHSSPQPLPFDDPNNAHDLLRALLSRDDGWLRVVPDSDGKLVWWKWKFTRGKWSGYYAMVRGFSDRHNEAMDILYRKLSNIDLGYERPSRDSYYDQG